MLCISRPAVEQLRSSLSSTALVLTPSSEGYSESISRWASSAEKRAGLVVFPITAEDVATAVQFSVRNGLQLAVGGGFHGWFSSIEGGMSINMSKMNGVTVDPLAKTITAQGGALWSDVDLAAAKHNLAAVGGTVNSVGVSGLSLGGGYGYLSGAHGLVVDNILSAELVLADRQIVTASDAENQDLFWALRGAGASFGAVTKLVFRAHEQTNMVWGGTLSFSEAQLADVIEFANHTMEVSQGEATMMVGFSTMNAALEASVVAVVFYNGTEADAKAFYAPLLALSPSSDDTAMVPYSSVNSWHNAAVTHGNRRAMKGSALMTPISPTFVEGLFRHYANLVENVEDASKSLVLFDFFSFKKTMEVSQSATAFANRGALVNILFAPAWNSKSWDKVCERWALNMAATTEAELQRQKANGADEMTMSAAGEYINYDGFGSSSLEKVFGANLERLTTLKKKYDAQNVFKTGHNLLPRIQTLAIASEKADISAFSALKTEVAA